MKKILFCSSFIDQAQTGSAIFAQLFLDWAATRDILVDIISSEKSSKRDIIPLVSHNWIFTKLPILNQYHRSYIFYKTVSEVLKSSDYDYIFFNSVVESLHTSRFIKDISVFAFLHDENFMNDYKKDASWKRKIYRNSIKKLENKAANLLDKVLTNSKYMKLQIERVYQLHPLKVEYFHFRSFDLNCEKKDFDCLSSKKEIRILFVKHDYERGGLFLLLEALESISGYTFNLQLVGFQSNQSIDDSFSNGVIQVYERLTRSEIKEAYQNADIFCVPSQSEALGLANLEAMQIGLPVVALDIPVLQELSNLYGQQIAFLASRDNLTEIILECIENDERRKLVIQNAMHFIETTLTQTEVYQSFDKIFS